MSLSPHFDLIEFEPDGPAPSETVPLYTSLCSEILEPIRARVNQPIIVTSGYRDDAANAAAGGVLHSQHDCVAPWTFCAADFKIDSQPDLRNLFDWVRLKSGLPVDQLILEHGTSGHDILHASWVTGTPRREALEGDTANRSGYTSWPFNSPEQAAAYAWPNS